MKLLKNKVVQLVLFISFGILLLYLVFINQKKLHEGNCHELNGPNADCNYLDQILQDLAGANLWWVVLSILLYVLSNIARAKRWQLLFKPLNYAVDFSNAFCCTMIGYLINLGLPRAGEVAKIAALANNEKIPVEKVAGTIVVDRTMDLVCLAIMMVIAVTFEYDAIMNFVLANASFNPWMLTLLLIPIAMLLVFLRIRKTSNLGIIKKINGLFEGFSDGLLSVFRMKQKALFLFYSFAIWACYYLMTYLVFFSFEPTAHLGPTAGVVVFIFGALGMVIPSPGGAGTYHYLISKGLEVYKVTEGFVLANILFIPIQVFGNIIFGVVSYVLLPKFKKDEPTYISEQKDL